MGKDGAVNANRQSNDKQSREGMDSTYKKYNKGKWTFTDM